MDTITNPYLIWPLACGVAVAFLLLARWRGSERGQWLSKPLASACFLALCWSVADWSQSHARWIGIGLLLGAIGDQLLIRAQHRAWFLSGLVAFLLGHLAYLVAFLGAGQTSERPVIAAVLLSVLLTGVWRWASPGVPPMLRLPVLAYLVVIGAMVVAAVSAAQTLGMLACVGAVSFAASDVGVARERFVRPGIVNQLVSYPLYFGGQLLLAATTAVGL